MGVAARMGNDPIHFLSVTTGFYLGIAVVIANHQFKDFFGWLAASRKFRGAGCGWWGRQHQFAFPAGWTDERLDLSSADPVLPEMVCRHRFSWSGDRHRTDNCSVEPWTVPKSPPSHRVQLSLGGDLNRVSLSFYRVSGCRGNCLADGPVLGLSLGLIKDLLGPAMAIALLGTIRNRYCNARWWPTALTGIKHDPTPELIRAGHQQRRGAVFSGIAATGALARHNIRAGARSVGRRLPRLVRAVGLAGTGAAAGLSAPMAALAALLLLVAWNMRRTQTLSSYHSGGAWRRPSWYCWSVFWVDGAVRYGGRHQRRCGAGRVAVRHEPHGGLDRRQACGPIILILKARCRTVCACISFRFALLRRGGKAMRHNLHDIEGPAASGHHRYQKR